MKTAMIYPLQNDTSAALVRNIALAAAAFALLILAAAHPLAAIPVTEPTTAPALKPNIVQLDVPAAALPEPALQYELTPAPAERARGNAAPIYLEAFLQSRLSGDEQAKVAEMLAAPRGKFPAAQARQIVDSRRSYFSRLDLAARCTTCSWEITYREDGFATLLPHLQPCRQASHLLALKARVEAAEGRFDDAIRTLQIGFALVQHLKNDAVLVQGLVAQGMTSTLLDVVCELQQTPGAPNLYWALAGLPPPVDVRAMIDIERSLLGDSLPQLKDRRPTQLTAADVSSLLARLEQLAMPLSDPSTRFTDQLRTAAIVAQAVIPARQWLQSHGYSESQANDMPPVQAVGIYFLATYEISSDNIYKWARLPYWQAHGGLAVADQSLREDFELNPFLRLMPALERVFRNIALLERRIAFLQTVEALRGYAAAHGGKLPASLDDLLDTPVPQDPVTGKPFSYQVTGNTVVLRSLAPAERENELSGVYQVTIR